MTIEQAKQFGKIAFKTGIRVPAQHKEFMEECKKVTGLLPYLNAWISGWSQAHHDSTSFTF